jgi:hypothetical protein
MPALSPAYGGMAVSGALFLWGIGQSILERQLALRSAITSEIPVNISVETADHIHDPIQVRTMTVVKPQEYIEIKIHTENYGYATVKTDSGNEESRTLLDSLNVDLVKHDHELSAAAEGALNTHDRDHPLVSEAIDGNGCLLADMTTKQQDATRSIQLNGDASSYYDLFMSNAFAPIVSSTKEDLKQFDSQYSFWYLPCYICIAQLVFCWVFDCACAIFRIIKSATTNTKPNGPKTGSENEREKGRDQEEAEKMSKSEHTTTEQVEHTTGTMSEELDMEPEDEPITKQRDEQSRTEEVPPPTEIFEESETAIPQNTGHPKFDKNGTTIALFRQFEEQETSDEQELSEEDEYESRGRSDHATDEPIQSQEPTWPWENQKNDRKDGIKDEEDLTKLFEGYPFKDIFLQLFSDFEEIRKKQHTIDEILQQAYNRYSNLKNTVEVGEMASDRGGYHLLNFLVPDSQTENDVMMQVQEQCGDVQYEDLVAFCVGLLVKKTERLDFRERRLHGELREMRQRVAMLMVLVILVIMREGAMMIYRGLGPMQMYGEAKER